MVGFNNLGFDYEVIHQAMHEPYVFDNVKAWNIAQNIFKRQYDRSGNRLHQVRFNDRLIPQCDLFRINHFDNPAKSTSLKALQFAMRSASVEDLPFDPAAPLTTEMIDKLISYNIHDVTETEKFGSKCKHLIELRQDLIDTGVLTGDVLNYADTKIGTEYLISKIGRAKCFVSGSKPRQTFRTEVNFKDVILPKIYFRTEPFEQVLDWFKSQTLYISKNTTPKHKANLGGIEFVFGIGGVHASVSNRYYESLSTHTIVDLDVAGMYVAVAITNGFAPEHLGKDFSVAYKQLQKDRAQYKKGTTLNAVLKLAGNGVYGNSNNDFSCFYDPKYTFTVTVNGQLQLCQLAEALSLIPGLELIQANTDGVTALVPNQYRMFFDMSVKSWEQETGYKLEEAIYSKMWIRDVNNYVALKKDGSIKRKGAYWYPVDGAPPPDGYEGNWNKNFSATVVQKGIEQVMVNATKPEEIVYLMTDPFDFMLRAKAPSGAKLMLGNREMQKTVRYYVSKSGERMQKVSKPTGEIGTFKRKNGLEDDVYKKILAEIPKGVWDERIHNKKKSKYEQVFTTIESGRLVKECNRAEHFDWKDVDFDYYINEIKKLQIGESDERNF